MPIRFTKQQLDEVRENHTLWYEGRLGRPLVQVILHGAYPPDRTPAAPFLSQANCQDLSLSPEQIVDAMDAVLSTRAYLGDGYPRINMDAFGPGVLAAFLGARPDNSSGRVWFFPAKPMEIRDIHVRYDPDNVWARRIRDIYMAGRERWDGNVVMTLPDLGGILDVAAVLRGTENLLMDLYDEPDEVRRLCLEIRQAWREAYADFASAMPRTGFSDWAGLLCDSPAYILQSDFSYMIGPDMYGTFVLPDVESDVEWLSHSMYHLDGIGALGHLDALLGIPGLDAVQWVPGDGQPGPLHWMDVYRRIRGSGKGAMVLGTPEDLFGVAREVGAQGLYYCAELSASDRAGAEALLSFRG